MSPTQSLSSAFSGFDKAAGALGESLKGFVGVAGGFSESAGKLAQALEKAQLPSNITMTTRSDVNVMLNGGAALQAMTNDLRASILSAVEKKIYEILPDALKSLPAR